MFQTLLLLGIACVIAAVVGGGLQLADIVALPVVSSPARQILLALIGLAIVAGDIAFVGPDDGSPPPEQARLPNDCVAELREHVPQASATERVARRLTVEVHPGPAAVAISRRYVWVAHTDGRVTAIPLGTRGGRADPLIGVQVGTRHTRGQVGIAFGMGFAWITKREGHPPRGFLAKVDRSGISKQVDLAVPDSVAVGGGSVWVTDDDGGLSRWAPGDLRRVSRRPIHGDPHGLWAGGRCIYVATTSPDGFIAFDAETGRRVPKAVFTVGGADEVAAAGGYLWLTDMRAHKLLRVDPRQPTEAKEIPLPVKPYFDALAAGEHSVWTADGDRTVVQIDPAAELYPHEIVVDGNPIGLAVSGDPEAIWIAQHAAHQITRITP